MIRDLKAVADYLAAWMKDQADKAGATGATVGVSGGIDSALTLALAVRAFGRDNVVGVLMPCHSSESSTARGKELVTRFEVPYEVVDLSASFESIRRQTRSPEKDKENFAYGALRSCLRAPTLDFVAKCRGHLVFGTGNRDEDLIFRYYQKRGDGAVDNNTIVCLHKSEVYQLSEYLGVPPSIINAVPSADLWGPDSGQEDEKELGISYEEIEWVTREQDRIGVVFDDISRFGALSAHDMPRHNAEKVACRPYTDREWFVIERARAAEKATRHKAEPPAGPERAQLIKMGILV